MATTSPPTRSKIPRWESFATRTPYLGALIAIHVAIVVVLAVLAYISDREHGITSLPRGYFVGSQDAWALPLLWTSLPPLVMTLLGLAWSSTFQAVRDRQPFADLLTDGGSSLDRTLLLDYRTTIGPLQWVRALRNRHWLVGILSLAVLLLLIAVPPLSARLFTDQVIFVQTDAVMNVTHRYNWTNTGEVNWMPVFDTVAAVGLFGAAKSPWTDAQFAFDHFEVPSQAVGADTVTAVAGKVIGYLADADCVILTEFDSELDSRSTLYVSGTDRGCDFQLSFTTVSGLPILFGTHSEQACGADAGFSRIIFVSGSRYDNSLGPYSNLSVVSCMTGYMETPGVLSVRPKPNEPSTSREVAPEMLSFKPEGQSNVFFGKNASYQRLQEYGMLLPLTYNPNTPWQSSEFGSLVLYHTAARKIGSSFLLNSGHDISLPTPADIITSFEYIFRLAYITVVANMMMQPLAAGSENNTTPGIITSQTTRLVLVPWVAHIVLALLGLCLPCGVWVLVYVRRHPTVLLEEPSGILSYFGILHPMLSGGHGDTMTRIVTKAREAEDYEGRVVESIRKVWKTESATCTVTDDEGGNMVLVIKDLSERE